MICDDFPAPSIPSNEMRNEPGKVGERKELINSGGIAFIRQYNNIYTAIQAKLI
jgi:hypothetical protein